MVWYGRLGNNTVGVSYDVRPRLPPQDLAKTCAQFGITLDVEAMLKPGGKFESFAKLFNTNELSAPTVIVPDEPEWDDLPISIRRNRERSMVVLEGLEAFISRPSVTPSTSGSRRASAFNAGARHNSLHLSAANVAGRFRRRSTRSSAGNSFSLEVPSADSSPNNRYLCTADSNVSDTVNLDECLTPEQSFPPIPAPPAARRSQELPPVRPAFKGSVVSVSSQAPRAQPSLSNAAGSAPSHAPAARTRSSILKPRPLPKAKPEPQPGPQPQEQVLDTAGIMPPS